MITKQNIANFTELDLSEEMGLELETDKDIEKAILDSMGNEVSELERALIRILTTGHEDINDEFYRNNGHYIEGSEFEAGHWDIHNSQIEDLNKYVNDWVLDNLFKKLKSIGLEYKQDLEPEYIKLINKEFL